MRISDWSSDVCSSDLFTRVFDRKSALMSALLYLALPLSFYATTLLPEVEFQLSIYLVAGVIVLAGPRPRYLFIALTAAFCVLRSEAHTSELQYLMRISYAVCCLN